MKVFLTSFCVAISFVAIAAENAKLGDGKAEFRPDIGPVEARDGDPSTFARRKSPCSFSFSFKEARKTCGLRIVSQPDRFVNRAPFALRVLADGREVCKAENMKPCFAGESQFLSWPVATAKDYCIEVADSGLEAVLSWAEMWEWGFIKVLDAWGVPRNRRGEEPFCDIAEVSFFDVLPEDAPGWNRFPARAYPESRLEKDWRMQDFGFDGFAKAAKTCGADYYERCRARRVKRLQRVAAEMPRIVYVKHYTIAGDAELSGNAMLSDSCSVTHPRHWRKGGQLCLLTVRPDGTVGNEVLVDCPLGMIRDPDVSHDGKRILFSMRRTFSADEDGLGSRTNRRRTRADYDRLSGDDFHLYVLDVETRAVKQLTFSDPARCADYEGVWTSAGQILFQSTRCGQVIPCHTTENANLFVMDADGSHIRRVGYDGGATMYPQELPNGGFIYTRYEYNDRSARLQQPLFRMNPDFTLQTEYYGNNSRFPTSLIHFRPVPGSDRLIGIVSGHHVAQKGKLVLLDALRGNQADDGILFVAGSSFEETPGVVKSHYAKHPVYEKAWRNQDPFIDDFSALIGPQWQYPYPIDEGEWLTGFQPEGSIRGSRCGEDPNFGIYWQNETGERELLAYDPEISCSQPVPLRPRPKARIARPMRRDRRSAFGRFYIQDVYSGQAMKGVRRGTVKSLRVVAIENRASFHRRGSMYAPHDPEFKDFISYYGDTSGDAIGVGGSAWDVKHVLGEVSVDADGSCLFEAPAATPLYFQLLDDKGRCVQTMRSWTALQPGEFQGCAGCHETKLEAPPFAPPRALVVQRIDPAGGLGRHPLLKRLEEGGRQASLENYMGVQAVRTADAAAPTEGFSYRRLVQPILDRSCVRCHDGTVESRPNLTGNPVRDPRIPTNPNDLVDAGRAFSESYFALTAKGRQTPLLNWYSSTGTPFLLPPCAQGSARSAIMDYLTPRHHGVQTTDAERRLFACWIDLGVPFSGSYSEATVWNDDERWIFDYHQRKREAFARREKEDR